MSAILGVWILIGAGLDAWAHVKDSTVESFFTPWHGVLYSGFAAMVIWTVHLRAIDDARLYRLSSAGLVLFGVGGVGDLVWHSAFGIERELAAVTSPTHVMLFMGAVLILSGPLRKAWLRSDVVLSWRPFLPVILSATSVGAIGMLVFFYASAFLPRARAGGQLVTSCVAQSCESLAELYSTQQDMLSSIVISNVLVFAPILVLARRWVVPILSFAPLIAAIVAGQLMIVGFSDLEPLAGAVVGGIAVDVVYVLVKPHPDRHVRLRIFGGAAPTLFWGIYVVWIRLAYGVPWPTELLVGSIVWTAIAGTAMAAMLTTRVPGPGDGVSREVVDRA